MPNHITNKVTIKGKAKDVKIFMENIKSKEGSIDFNKIKPMPKDIFHWNLGSVERKIYGKNNWYDWSIDNWGTKWNAYESYDDCDKEELNKWEKFIECELFFFTAWSAPIPIYNKIYKKYIIWMNLDIDIEVEFADEDIWANYWTLYISKDWVVENYEHLSEEEGIRFACEVNWIDADEYLEELKNEE